MVNTTLFGLYLPRLGKHFPRLFIRRYFTNWTQLFGLLELQQRSGAQRPRDWHLSVSASWGFSWNPSRVLRDIQKPKGSPETLQG